MVNATAVATSGAQRGGPPRGTCQRYYRISCTTAASITLVTHEDPHFGGLCDGRYPSIFECVGQSSERGGSWSCRTESPPAQRSDGGAPGDRLFGGQLLSAISTGIVKMLH